MNAPSASTPASDSSKKRLSELLGEHTWHQSGLGAPTDIDALNHKITQLEQQAADLRIQLNERDDELAAARAANRELMTRINRNPKTDDTPPPLVHDTCCARYYPQQQLLSCANAEVKPDLAGAIPGEGA